MIFDGPSHFPDSVVQFTPFKFAPIRELFAALREREECLQKDLRRAVARLDVHLVGRPRREAELRVVETRAALRECERALIWMATNVGPDYRVFQLEDVDLEPGEKPEQLALADSWLDVPGTDKRLPTDSTIEQVKGDKAA